MAFGRIMMPCKFDLGFITGQEGIMANIESVLQEHRVFPPAKEFVQQATVSGMAAYEALCHEAAQDNPGF